MPSRRSKTVPVRAILPSRFFTRPHVEDEAFLELCRSIERTGGPIHQPVVRDRGRGRYEIVCGFRRWQAMRRAGQKLVRVDVVPLDDREAVLWMLTENVLRQDLDSVTEAELYWMVARTLQKVTKGGGSPPRLSARQAADLLSPHVGKSADTIRKVLATLPEDPKHRDTLRQVNATTEHIRFAQSLVRKEAGPQYQIEEAVWVQLAKFAAEKRWSVSDFKSKARWARTLSGEASALRSQVRQGKASLLAQVRTFFDFPEAPPQPEGRRHRCPHCWQEWRGKCWPEEVEGEAGPVPRGPPSGG